MDDFVVVEYLDEHGQPRSRYAKRYRDGEQEVELDALNEKTGQPVKVKVKVPKYRDEPIPTRIYCIVDAAGNIVGLSEVHFSKAVDIEGKEHPFRLAPGCECHPLEQWPAVTPAELARAGGDVRLAVLAAFEFDRGARGLKRKAPA